MEQLTPLQQELNREPNIPEHYIEGEPEAYIDGYKTGFKDGAQWQKEQYKELLHLSRQIIDAYHIRYPDADQLLVGYTHEELFKKLLKLRESLQD